jgi:hypothetical protein
MGIIFILATAEPVSKVLIVLVSCRGLFRVNVSLRTGLSVDAQSTGRRGGQAGGSTVTDEVPLVEEFDEGVFTMAGDGAGIADAGRCVWSGWIGGRRIAGETGEKTLAQSAERASTGVELLENG